jgi:hypothetical protein
MSSLFRLLDPPWFNQPNNIWWRVEIMRLFIIYFFQVKYSSNTLHLYSSLTMTDQVSCSYKTKGKTIKYCHVIMTIDGFWIDDWIYWTLLQPLTTLYKSLLHTGQCSQSRCLVTASNWGRSSASGLTSLQACDYLTPTPYSAASAGTSFSQLVLGTGRKEKHRFHSSSVAACATLATITWRLQTVP